MLHAGSSFVACVRHEIWNWRACTDDRAVVDMQGRLDFVEKQIRSEIPPVHLCYPIQPPPSQAHPP